MTHILLEPAQIGNQGAGRFPDPKCGSCKGRGFAYRSFVNAKHPPRIEQWARTCPCKLIKTAL